MLAHDIKLRSHMLPHVGLGVRVDMSTFGTRLRERRKAKGLTQAQIAQAAGRTSAAVSNWERDENEPDSPTLNKVADRLDTTPAYLLWGSEESADPAKVPVAGSIRAGGVVTVRSATAPEMAPRTPGLGARAVVALHVEDVHNVPVYRPGDLVYIAADDGHSPTEFVGEDVVVELNDGRRLLRQLLPGPAADSYTLRAWAGAELVGVAVTTVWPVLSVLRASANNHR